MTMMTVTQITTFIEVIIFIAFILFIFLLTISLCKTASRYDKEYENIVVEDLILNNSKCLNEQVPDSNKVEHIKIKYFSDEIDKIQKMEYGNWIDLRSAETAHLNAGEFKLISLGIGMKLPEGYEAHIAPRSSTFKNFGIIQTNSVAVIDNAYSGDNDCWFYPVYALRDTDINVNDRICQFRIVKEMPVVKFEEVEHLDSINRGGHGSTGIK